jgi:O-antigen ligase
MVATNRWVKLEDNIALLGFGVLSIALPFSNLFMSIGMFTVSAAALSRIVRIIILRNNASHANGDYWVLLPALIWLLTLAGGLNSENTTHWLWDLRVKLPLLLIPLFAFLFRDLIRRQILALIGLYTLGVSSACVICLCFALSNDFSGSDIRNASLFISHIRFGLMIALVIPLLYFAPGISVSKRNHQLGLLLLLIILFLSFEIISANITGLFMMGAVLVFITGHYVLRNRHWLARAVAMLSGLFIISVLIFLRAEYNSYFSLRAEDLSPMERLSDGGEAYLKCEPPFIVEGGRITGRYIALNELDSAWFARAQVGLDNRDGRGQPLKFTLIRYLTSLDLRKDAVGISKLNDIDVQNILRGQTNSDESNRSALANRMNALFYEWSVYRETGLVSGHSLFQRFEFWRAAWNIIRQNIWLGVGAGDVPMAFENSYVEIGSALNDANRLRAHNQFLTFWIAFGLIGLAVLVFVLGWPIYKFRFALHSCFVMISFLSFLTEDTLETQAGVCFFALFSAILTAARLE